MRGPPDLDALPAWAWCSKLVLSWFRHLHNIASYVELGLNEYRYVDGSLLPADTTVPGSVRISADALPAHAVRIEQASTEDAGNVSGERRDAVELVGVVVLAAHDDPPGCERLERVMTILEASVLEPELRRDLEALLGGEVQFTIDGGPDARREGSGGRPSQWAWRYRLRLTGPYRQIIA